MSVSTNKWEKKNKSKKEALKKNISPPRVQKSSEPRIAGIIPLWQLREKIPFFILPVVLVIITFYTPDNTNVSDAPYFKQFPLISRIANVPVAFVTYLEKTFWPHDMAILYPFPTQIPLWQVLGASLLILVISVAVIVMMKRLPYLFAGWMWFSIIVAPVIGIIQVSVTTPYAMADRYHYLPSIGLAVMLAWGIPALIKSEEIRKKFLFPAGIIFLVIISFLSWQQCGYWKNSITIFNHVLEVTNNNYIAHNNLGDTLSKKGETAKAIYHFDKAIFINSKYPQAYYNRGNAYAKLGQYQLAIENYNQAIRLNQNYADAYNNRGLAYDELGQYHLAIENYNQAIRLKPNYADAYYNWGNAYAKLGQYQLAIEDYNQAIRLNPNYAKAFFNRGFTYLLQGNNELGCPDAQKACALGNCKLLEMGKGKGYCR